MIETAWYNCIDKLLAYRNNEGRLVLVGNSPYDAAALLNMRGADEFENNELFRSALPLMRSKYRSHLPRERPAIYGRDSEGRVVTVTRVTIHEEVIV